TVPFAFGQLLGFLGVAGFAIGIGCRFVIPPRIELKIANRDLLEAIAVDQRLQRAGVTLAQVVIVIISRAVVGPVTQILQRVVGFIRWSRGAAQRNQPPAPDIPGLVDAIIECDQSLLRKTR